MSKKIITLKDPGNYNAALLAVACSQGHGNKTQVILESLDANPLIAKELKKLAKKSSKN